MALPSYPHVPRSNARLQPGEFWAIPLSTGRYACGVVLGVARVGDERLFAPNNRAFLAGLLDWEGDAPPTAEAIAGARVMAQGIAHVKAIAETGGEILGRSVAPVAPLTWRSAPGPADEGWVYEGVDPVRPATPADNGLGIVMAWGYGYIRELAGRASVERSRRLRPGR